jgi:hypothetical protein
MIEDERLLMMKAVCKVSDPAKMAAYDICGSRHKNGLVVRYRYGRTGENDLRYKTHV